MLYLANFDWEHAQLVNIALNLVDGELIIELDNARTRKRETVRLRVEFHDIAYIGLLRDKSIDRPPTEIKAFREEEAVASLALEVDKQGEFIQMNFKDGWSRAVPKSGTFLQFNTYSLAAGALRLEWIAPVCDVTIL